jgi:hypothetical protein
MLQAPLVALALVIATLYSALFHLLLGESLRELVFSWLAAVVGFFAGQAVASALGWRDIRIGDLRLLTATLACWCTMAFVRRLDL